MSNFFQKPENALKRCEELTSVGQKTAAMDVLEAVIKSKRHRQWTPILEDILKRFLSLCTESRQPRRAKEGLIQYRGIAQNAAAGPESILKVVTSFINDGEKSVREAEEKAGLGAEAVASLQDLEAEETPETMLMAILTGEISDTGRADRDNYVQWLRFLWESYRTCLEILKNNPKLEELYADTAKKTFQFCVNYKRKVEFRRLKDLLKTHLNAAHAQSNQLTVNESTLRLRVEIRAEQLNAACKLELWQLAFESAEELHVVINHPVNRKAFKYKAMMNFYEKLSQIFWVSENYLFHAFALQKIFHLTERKMSNEMKKGDTTREKAQAQMQVLASKLLLGALAVPLPAMKSMEDFDQDKDKQQRMANLVGHSSIPQRRTIVQDLVARNIAGLAFPELQELFTKIEGDFEPRQMGGIVKPILSFIEGNAELKKYLEPLKKMLLLKLVQQLSGVYMTMKISEFATLADFMSLHSCEKIIVEAVARNQAGARLDHKSGTLHLGDNGLESETRRWQLTNLAKGLQSTLDLIHTDLREQARAQKVEAFKQLADSLEDERKMMMRRRQQIEERKENMEREMQMKAMEEERRRKQEEDDRAAAEIARKEEDKKRREEARLLQEKEEKELAEKKRLKEQVEALKAEDKKKKGAAITSMEEIDEDELKNMDKAALIQAKREQEEKLKREAEERIASQVQKLDHLERARRENERPLLAKVFEEQKVQDKVRWEIESKQFMENHKKKHEEDVQIKATIVRMMGDKSKFEEMVKARREAEYQRELAEHRERTKKEAERRRKEREERERREREEEERRQVEEEEKRRRMEEEKRAKEEERARLDAVAEKQRQREAEIEARQREREQGAGGPPAEGPRGGGPPERGSGLLDRPAGGDREGPGGARWQGGPERGGEGGSRYQPPGQRGGEGGGRWGGPPGSDRGGDRWGGGDRGPPADRWGGGDRGERGPPRDDRGPPREDRGPPSDRWGGGGGGAPPRDGGGRWGGGGDRGGDRWGGGDRAGGAGGGGGGGGGDRWGGGGGGGGAGGGGRFGDSGGGGGQWRRSDEERPQPAGDRAPPGERPRLNLQPRSRPAADQPAEKKQDDDGFTAVTRKR